MDLLLASASPRRKELLERAGYAPIVRAVEVDERTLVGEQPDAYLERVVEAKLGAALAHARQLDCELLLVADTVVLCDERILGKPQSRQHAASMIADLAGRSHVVASRFAIAQQGKLAASETVRTKVWFRSLSPAEIARYVATGEGEDKAGGYAIQGIGACLVERIAGSYTSVVGLPLAEVVVRLEQLGLPAMQRSTSG